MADDLHFMQLALAEARASAEAGEVPIGALLVHNDAVLASAGNRTIRDNDPTAHAEIVVIREAARLLSNYRLADTILYVTLEPCAMCAGAIIQARIPRLVYAADDPKGGAFRSCFEILTSAKPLHQVLDPWLRRQKGSKAHDEGPLLDPHKRVDTSSFLLQRTRRVSDALTCLRRRLERPVVSEQALEWRLRGPVGVIALAQAVGKEARSEQERCFLLTELCLELARVRPQTSPGSFSPARVCKSLRQVTQEIRATISSDALTGLPALATYVNAAFEEVAR